MVEPAETAQEKEAWATGEKYFSIGLESFATHIMQSFGSLPTDCFSTSYSTFVMYLAGKVKKVGGSSTASRIFTGIARAGTRAAADVAGDVSSDAESEINRAAYDYRFPQFERSNRIVEVASGTRFTFTVSR